MGEVSRAIVDADFFISYLREDDLSVHAEALYRRIQNREIRAEVSSEVFDDIVSAYRSQGYALGTIEEILEGLRTVSLEVVPVTARIAKLAISLYREFGGRRKLHYFDAFHVATARVRPHNSLITSHRFILEHSVTLQIKAIDLKTY